MDAATLSKMVAEDAALRRRQRLQPVGGKGDKIFPPTYPGEGRRNPPPRHVFERRRLDGREAWCVLIDSVQSQANRLEESLLGVIASGKVTVPHISVDFAGRDLAGINKITSLDAPHRVYDAIFRDSLLDGEPFMKSPLGKRLAKANNVDASALLEVSPTALLFGCWYSTGQGGGLGAKFARCLVSEIVGVDVPVEEPENFRSGELVIEAERRPTLKAHASLFGPGEGEAETAGRRTGSRIDPLGILASVPIYKKAGEDDWTSFEREAEVRDGKRVLYARTGKGKPGRPALINHGNIKPSVQSLGVTCDYVEHTFVLSFAALRRLHFGSPEKDAAGRTLLAALGLLALAQQDTRGYALRSRCDLVCEAKARLDQIAPDGSVAPISDFDALALYQQAFESTEKAGIKLRKEPVELKPEDKLVEIVRQSQEKALAGKAGEESESGEDSESPAAL